MLTLVLLLLAANPLEQAETACMKSLNACPEYERLKAAQKQADRAAADARVQDAGSDQLTRQYEEARAEEQAVETARAARCGADYQQVRVGMKFKRVADCLGVTLTLAGERSGVQRYETARGWVFVRRGVVVGWDKL